MKRLTSVFSLITSRRLSPREGAGGSPRYYEDPPSHGRSFHPPRRCRVQTRAQCPSVPELSPRNEVAVVVVIVVVGFRFARCRGRGGAT